MIVKVLLEIELEITQEEDRRYIAEVPKLPGVMAYGGSLDVALAKAEGLALRVLADRLEMGEMSPLGIERI